VSKLPDTLRQGCIFDQFATGLSAVFLCEINLLILSVQASELDEMVRMLADIVGGAKDRIKAAESL
jgi:hypothetical protein